MERLIDSNIRNVALTALKVDMIRRESKLCRIYSSMRCMVRS